MYVHIFLYGLMRRSRVDEYTYVYKYVHIYPHIEGTGFHVHTYIHTHVHSWRCFVIATFIA